MFRRIFSSTPPPRYAGRKTRLEVQIHSADIQRGVVYLFLSRRHFVAGSLLLALFLALVGWSALRAPSVIGGLLQARTYEGLVEARVLLEDQVGGLETRLVELQSVSESLQLRMNKIYLAYGLSDAESIGQGGYPFAPRELPPHLRTPVLERTSELETKVREQTHVLQTFLLEIEEFEREHQDQVASTPSISPLRGDRFVLTSPFGSRHNPFTKQRDFHAGIDLAAPLGMEVYAAADGVVTFASRYSSRQSVGWWRYGNLVTIQHGDLFISLYGHLQGIKVRAGQKVRQGDIIGTVGNTGWSTNPHLHYEVRRFDEQVADHRPVDPRIYILDHRWRDEERLLVRARSAPDLGDYEPLPNRFRR